MGGFLRIFYKKFTICSHLSGPIMAAPGRISKKSTLFKKSSQKIHNFLRYQIFPKMLKSPTLSQHYASDVQTGGPRWCKSEIADRGHICKIFTSKVDRLYGPIFSRN